MDSKLHKPIGAQPLGVQQYKNCQSCGMPLKKDPQHGGTEADGRKSTMYCSHCYRNGKFILPDITAVQMQARVKRKMTDKGFPGFIAGLFVRNIPKLERWTKAQPLREDNLMRDDNPMMEDNL